MRGLAVRMGLGEHFPVAGTLDELLDHRVARIGLTFAELAEIGSFGTPPTTRKYEQAGFATPSGRVELASRC